MTAREVIAEVLRRDYEWVTDAELADAILAALRAAGFSDRVVDRVWEQRASLVDTATGLTWGDIERIGRAMLAAAAEQEPRDG